MAFEPSGGSRFLRSGEFQRRLEAHVMNEREHLLHGGDLVLLFQNRPDTFEHLGVDEHILLD